MHIEPDYTVGTLLGSIHFSRVIALFASFLLLVVRISCRYKVAL